MIRRLAGLAACLVVLAACSGVPTSSSPAVIRTVTGGVAPFAASSISPPAGAEPRTIVSDFLSANASEDAHHTGARSYLTAQAAKNWVDSTAVIVSDYTTGVPDPLTNSVTVTADKVGALDKGGIYTPVTQGTGTAQINVTFGMQQVKGEWRINGLNNGLIVTQADFLQTYRPRPVYFFDQSQKRLVPDLRYSPLSDQSLCTWLLDQLSAGPRPELQAAYSSDLPEQTAHATVSFGSSSIGVDLPGSSQLDAQTRVRLGVQLAFTFDIDFASSISLTDGAKAVAIPRVTSPFSRDSFPSFSAQPPPSAVYYVHNGAVVDDSATPVEGLAGTATAAINSFAIAQRSGTMLLASTTGKPDSGQHLVVGTLNGPQSVVADLTGPMTRPAWAPGLSEVWVGDGTRLIRVPSVGAAPVVVTLAASTGSVVGQIRSVAFSPDGVRVALIILAGDGSSQLWIGSIVRTADGASIDSLEPITPVGLLLTDVAWNDVNTLYATGADSTRPGTYGIWSVQVDGSFLTARPITNLPGAPDSIAASQNRLPWVSAEKAVWVQRGAESSWTAPSGAQTTLGSYPTYVE